MKWFRHISQAHADDKLVSIRAKFGMWGVGCYWTILELAAEQIKLETKDPFPKVTLSMSELSSFFGCKRNKLESFLDHLQNVCGMKCTHFENVIEIEVPKLLQLKDNYYAYFKETSKKL